MSNHFDDPAQELDVLDRKIRDAYGEVQATSRARNDAERALAACSAAYDRAGQRWFALVELRLAALDRSFQEQRVTRPAEDA